jgi:hypothetical protein
MDDETARHGYTVRPTAFSILILGMSILNMLPRERTMDCIIDYQGA